MVTSRSRYGLLFLIDLVDRGKAGPVDLPSVAARQGIPEAYLAKLVAPLKAAGILSSLRGAKGGYELSKAPESVTLLEIVDALEGRTSLLGIDTEGDAPPPPREGSADERVLEVWKSLDRAVRAHLSSHSLAEAAGKRGIEYHI